jgi:indolepyruvate ferredoxin oxidoreductase alpha subunit
VGYNVLDPSENDGGLGVVTAGVALGYYRENLPRLGFRPSHLHLGAFPIPVAAVRALAERVERVLVLEDGYPWLERQLRGLLSTPVEVQGRISGEVPATGELAPAVVAAALGLEPGERGASAGDPLPPRPPQLCQACPHRDSYGALRQALSGIEGFVVTGDIGCYTLGALPPFQAIESCVCMGAAVGMARGASEAGIRPAIGVIGDSTFLHSGVPALLDAAQEGTDMTLLILDNGAIGMTGAQDTAVPSSRLEPLVLGLGVDPEHCHVLDAHPRKVDELAAVIRREIDHPGLSVIIAARECIEHARLRKKAAKEAKSDEV